MASSLHFWANSPILFYGKAVVLSCFVLENSFVVYLITLIHSQGKKLSSYILQFYLQEGKNLSVIQIIVYPAQNLSHLSAHWAAEESCYLKKRTDGCKVGRGRFLAQLLQEKLSTVELSIPVRNYSMLLLCSPIILLVWRVSDQTFF